MWFLIKGPTGELSNQSLDDRTKLLTKGCSPRIKAKEFAPKWERRKWRRKRKLREFSGKIFSNKPTVKKAMKSWQT